MEHLDVLVVGAGLSGISAVRTLRARDRSRSVAVFEARQDLGGTWDLFRYPGIRSDSEMATFGYRDEPWTDPRALGSGSDILTYLRTSAESAGVTPLIRYGHRITRVEWDAAAAQWLVHYDKEGSAAAITCSFLVLCTGYYRYDEGFQPHWPGVEDYSGRLVHPQHWDTDLDVKGKRVVVIGSGATAITLVPALAAEGANVAMLQRSATYIAPIAAVDRGSILVRRLLPARAAASVNRWRSIARGSLVYAFSKRRPDAMRRVLRRAAQKRLPEGYDVDRHFSPAYNPWDERLCATPDGDFFAAVASGHAEIVTDTIAHFTTDGIALTSGRELAADVVVSATGLQLLVFGGIEIVVDGHVIEPRDTVSYRGMMLSGVPNLAFAIGYTNASWTLKIELVMAHVAQILAGMAKSGSPVVVPVSQEDPAKLEPLIDLSSGYIRRGAHLLPRQSQTASWRAHQSYTADRALFRSGLGDGVVFPRTRERAS